MDIFENTINSLELNISAFFSAIFGEFWFLFAFLMWLNFIEYVTGAMKARYLKLEIKEEQFKCIAKIFFIWILVLTSFGLSVVFMEIGKEIGVSLDFMMWIGWFMLVHCIVNEMRIILENIILLDKGNMIPNWLIKGLEVTQKIVDNKASSFVGKIESDKNSNDNKYENGSNFDDKKQYEDKEDIQDKESNTLN